MYTLTLNNQLVELPQELNDWFLPTILSAPDKKRYHTKYNGLTLLEVFNHVTQELSDDDIVKIDSGSYGQERTVKNWREVISFNLDQYVLGRNVFVNVASKTTGENAKPLATI